VRCQPNFSEETRGRIFEIGVRNAIAAALESAGRAMSHAEESGLMSARIETPNQVKQIRFRSTKRKVVLVAKKDTHSLALA